MGAKARMESPITTLDKNRRMPPKRAVVREEMRMFAFMMSGSDRYSSRGANSIAGFSVTDANLRTDFG